MKNDEIKMGIPPQVPEIDVRKELEEVDKIFLKKLKTMALLREVFYLLTAIK